MNSTGQDIVTFIENIYAARHLIAEAYCDGDIQIHEQNQKLLRKLQQIRAMRPGGNGDDSLRLSPHLRNLLDQALHRVRSYSISSNFGDKIGRMMTLTEGYMRAVIDGNDEAQDVYCSDFDLAAFDISEEVFDTILHVSTMAHTQFANVGNYAEKLRQNTHYLEQMKKLVSTLSTLQDPALMELLESSYDLRPLNQLYTRHIVRNMSSWRSMLMDIISHLERYLHKLRSVEPNARKIRLFSMFLARNPDYAPRDPDEYEVKPEWAYRHEGIALCAYPDLEDEDQHEVFAEVARSIESTQQAVLIEREEGVFIEDEDPLVVELEPSPFEQMVYDYIQEARLRPAGVSARSFFGATDWIDDSTINASLMCLAALLDNPRKVIETGADEVMIERIDYPVNSEFAGNILIEDFIACPKA